MCADGVLCGEQRPEPGHPVRRGLDRDAPFGERLPVSFDERFRVEGGPDLAGEFLEP